MPYSVDLVDLSLSTSVMYKHFFAVFSESMTWDFAMVENEKRVAK
jgi:hypothetical protein